MTNAPLDIDQPTILLGGLSPQAFMQDYWQRKPLLVRQAIPGFVPPLTMADIKALVRRDEVESRLILHDEKRGWSMKRGPFKRLPPATQANWTLLAQGVDLHDDAIAALMRRFRFIPDARLDDAMISIATEGGGVGPHFDSYDVFLLQAQGRRRWRISHQQDRRLVPGLPLKILDDFRPEQDDILEPGDMLYLPPHVCHEGIAIGDSMTISIGFRVPSRATLARGLLEAAADQLSAQFLGDPGLYGHPCLPGPDLSGLYEDATSAATRQPAALPQALIASTLDTLRQIRIDEAVAARFLGQWLTSLPDSALFDPTDKPVALAQSIPVAGRLVLDRCTRLMYGVGQVFINGEVAPLEPTPALQALADHRYLEAAAVEALPQQTRATLDEWLEEGWAHWQDQAASNGPG